MSQTVCFITRIGNSALSNTMSRWCNGSTWVSKTLGRSSSLWRDAKIWADSDNGSTVALQASGRGSIPRRSTKYTSFAKLVRHRILIPTFGGSSPSRGAKHFMPL